MNTKFIFIGGVGRTGKSVTKEILSQSNDVISFNFEYRFIIDPDGIIDFLISSQAWSPFILDKKIKRLELFLLKLAKPSFFKNLVGSIIRSNKITKSRFNANSYHNWNLERHLPNYRFHVKKLIDNLQEFSFRGNWVGADDFTYKSNIRYVSHKSQFEITDILKKFLKELFDDLFDHHKKEILVEDNTWNLLFLNEMSELFPGAKFIHLFRDPRDVVNSYCMQRWMPNDIIQSGVICNDLYNQVLKNISRTKENKENEILEVSIEDLVNNKEKLIKKITNFCNIAPNEKMFDYALTNKSIGRWKNNFTKLDLQNLEPILRETTEKLGYEW